MKCCGNCEYFLMPDGMKHGSFTCTNRASDDYDTLVDDSDCCYEYEEKEKLSVDEITELMKDCLHELNRLTNKLKEVSE